MLHQIGVGALGPVYRTYEPTRDRLVAVKVFRLDLTPEQASALADELRRAVDAGLVHASIVEPVAAGLEGTVAYRAEEYVAAESLDVAMRHYAPATVDKALPFLTQIAAAIDAARAAGVGHGALHPRDIFVTPDEARATGFGVVDALDRLGIRAPVRRPYSAPERIAGQPWSTPADVFSLGAIAFELLTGRRPSGLGDQMGSLAGASLGAHADAIHSILARAMHEDPSQRFQSASALAAALQELGGVEAVATPVPADETLPADAQGPAKASEVSETSGLDDFAAEPISLGDSPREVARRVIAARKRRPKPVVDDVPAAPPAALFDAAPRAEKGDDNVEREDQIAPEIAATDIIATEVAAEVAAPDVAEAEIAAAGVPASEPDANIDADLVPVERAPEIPLDDIPIAAAPAEPERLPESASIASAASLAAADMSMASAEISEPADAEAPIAREVHDRVVAVDEFRARETTGVRDVTLAARDASGLRSDRSWPRAHERSTPLPERAIVPPIASKSPIDPIDSDIPYVPIDETPTDRPRPSMLPLAMALLLGLVLGYMAGYVVGSREQAPDATVARSTPPPSSPAATTPAAPASSFSEGTVAPQTGGPAAASPRSETTAAPSATVRAPAAASKPTPPPARSRTGTIVVTSTPSNASVTVNGKWTGRTPLTLERPFGKYAIRVVQSGYDVASETVTLAQSAASRTVDVTLRSRSSARGRGATTAAPAATAAPSKPQAAGAGEIFIDSRPQGARVFIDGKPQGVTPLRLTGQSVGAHEVRLELADHQPWTATARVVAGTTVRVTGSLDRLLR
ncbi:MAG TPA: PEGA domain-containing protein [Vicinamibacterales bacterium]